MQLVDPKTVQALHRDAEPVCHHAGSHRGSTAPTGSAEDVLHHVWLVVKYQRFLIIILHVNKAILHNYT